LNSYVVDAWAWIEYLIGTKRGDKLKQILDEEKNEVYTCALTIAEVVSKVAREGRNADAAYETLVGNSQVIDIDEELSKQAGLLHAEMRRTEKDFGIADAYVLATARKLEAKVLSGDKHFKHAKDVVFME